MLQLARKNDKDKVCDFVTHEVSLVRWQKLQPKEEVSRFVTFNSFSKVTHMNSMFH
jgi:hypothetical protein